MMAMDISTLSLFPATPQQITESRRRTLHEWGKGLILEEHLARDAAQDHFDGSRDGKLITWVLAPRVDPQTLDFKCACETFKRTGLVVDKMIVETVPSYAVASVFTPLENRGRGFARHMMRLLHWVIADKALLPASEFPSVWGAPPQRVDGTRDGHFSALWSDVGQFYNACGPGSGTRDGWVVRGTATTVWDVDATSVFPSDNTTLDWTWLDDSGVSRLWENDAETIQLEMKNSGSPGTSFAYLPTQGVASFQHRRLDFFLQRLPNPPQTWGVASPNNSTYATWTIDPRPSAPRTLTVSRLHADARNFSELVGKILEIAQRHDVKRVEVWNLPAELESLARTLGATTHMREEHLPAFKWYGKESEADVSWAFNERFCWC
ncbi:hypothetical protein C8R43DRAFT_25153 [Mycena crocata]|nr:hypothetical protein C8R43DRAFT_25153 [Mycena crocata]